MSVRAYDYMIMSARAATSSLSFASATICNEAEASVSCLGWAQKYLGACVCSPREEVSFALGLLSVLCWGVAEVPQIITNFREDSTEGVSLLFLMTWVVGDIFNLAGCYLEPSTLPTQFYMALLYTITTVILVGQVIYYNHVKKAPERIIMKWQEDSTKEVTQPPATDEHKKADEDKELPEPNQIVDKTTSPIPLVGAPTVISSPINYRHSRSPSLQGRDGLYYTSARSLASSRTPTAGSYLTVSGTRGSGGGQAASYSLLQHGSLEDNHPSPLRVSIDTSRSAPVPDLSVGSPILRAVISFAMCVAGLNIGRGLTMKHGYGGVEWSNPTSKPRVFQIGRKLLQVNATEGSGSLGVLFGWTMAAIYMGGRLPQIILNIKRGTVEGLNPLMFTFAVLGNTTYVGSILVASMEWTKIKSNMPWLVDAAVCVVLDFFILCQFVYYWIRKPKYGKDNIAGGAEQYKLLQ